MNPRIKGRKNYPTDEVDPENYISDEDVRKLVETKQDYKFTQEDYYKIYNCVHCGECETEEQARDNPFEYAVDEQEIDQIDYDVISASEDK